MSIFYQVKDLDLDAKKHLLTDAKKASFKWYINILDCNISLASKPSSLSFEEVIRELSESTHVVFINRGIDLISGRPYFETGFSTINSGRPDYLLFIHLYPKEANELIAKYGLTPIN